MRRKTLREVAQDSAIKNMTRWVGSVSRGFWASPPQEEIPIYVSGYLAGYRAAKRDKRREK